MSKKSNIFSSLNIYIQIAFKYYFKVSYRTDYLHYILIATQELHVGSFICIKIHVLCKEYSNIN